MTAQGLIILTTVTPLFRSVQLSLGRVKDVPAPEGPARDAVWSVGIVAVPVKCRTHRFNLTGNAQAGTSGRSGRECEWFSHPVLGQKRVGVHFGVNQEVAVSENIPLADVPS